MTASPQTTLRPDLKVILDHVEPSSRALDVGCGDGVLMAALRDQKQVDARGIEIDGACVERCVAQGLSVVQGDADHDLTFYPDGAFRLRDPQPDIANRSAARPDTARAAARGPPCLRQLPQFRLLADALGAAEQGADAGDAALAGDLV